MKRDDASQGFFLAGAAAVAMFCLMTVATTAQAEIVKYTPNMPVNTLSGRQDSDLVEFSDGRRISVGNIRRLTAMAQKMRAPRVDRMPAALRVKAAGTGTRVNNASDLATALKLPDSATVQLPSGQLATVGQIKLVQPLVEKRLGHSLTTVQKRPDLSGPAVKITSATTEAEWKAILQNPNPDSTVIESPNGKRITVSELKQYLMKNAKATPVTLPKSGSPVLTPKQR